MESGHAPLGFVAPYVVVPGIPDPLPAMPRHLSAGDGPDDDSAWPLEGARPRRLSTENGPRRAERAIGEPDTVARGGTGGLIPPTGANDDDGIDGELIDVTPKPEPEPAAVETKPDLEDGIDGEMA